MRLFFLFTSILLTLLTGAYAFSKVPVAPPQPTQAEIDAAIGAASAQGRIITVLAGGANTAAALKGLTSLPVIFRSTISGEPYDIVVISMSITPTGATLAAGCRFRVQGSGTDLYFGSNEIAVSGKSGFAGALPILESTLEQGLKEFTVPRLGNNFLMGLEKSSRLDFSCGAFTEFNLSGHIKVSNLVALEGAAGPVDGSGGEPLLVSFTGQSVADWKDMLIKGKVSSAFHSAAYPDLGFQFPGAELAQIDLSDFRSPENLPACAQVSGAGWQGIAFPWFRLRLPTFFNLRPGVVLAPASGSGLFLDGKGLIGSVMAENVYSLAQGYTDPVNKFDMSLSKLSADYSCNGQVTASMLGQIALGQCGVATPGAATPGAAPGQGPKLWYSFRYINGHYEPFVKDSEQASFVSGQYTLSTGSKMSFKLSPGALDIQASHGEKPFLSADVFNNSICRDFPATLSASGCAADKQLVWSTGGTGATVQVKPLQTTAYWVKCQDKYCVSASSDSLKITVYPSLPKPVLTAGREAICAYETTELRAENYVGTLEWRAPSGQVFTQGGAAQNVSFPGGPGLKTYAVRSNLNGCLSPETGQTVRVLAEPAAPTLYSDAPNNTIDRNGTVALGGTCTDGNRLVWENLGQAVNTVTLVSSATYRAVCKNEQTGCQSQASASITINVLYLPPAAPSGLAFLNITTNSLTLSWRDNAYNEDGFTVLRSASADFSNPQTIGQVGPDLTSINDSGLSEGATYYYQVIARNKYDQAASERASQRTLIKPSAPVLTAENRNIVKGGIANVYGTCASGTLVWTVPVGFGGGQRQQGENTTYWAKCVNQGIEGPGTSITVSVYTPAPDMPRLSVAQASIVKGGMATVTGTCQSGTLVWTVPVGFSGGQRVQNENTTYWAKCVNEGGESPGASVTVSVYTPAPNMPQLSATATSIEKGSMATVTGTCQSGTLVWTTPVGFGGGQHLQNENTTYWAKCVNEAGEGPGASITVNVYERPTAPRPNLRADKNPVKPNENTVVYADGCDGTVAWSNGSTGNSIWTGAGNYWAVCKKDGHRDSEAATITIFQDNTPIEQPQAPRPNLRADKNPVKPNENTVVFADGCDGTVSWSTGSTGNSIWTGAGDYWAICRKDGHRDSERAYITVALDNEQPQAPRPNLRADKNPVKPNENTVVFADGCDGTVSWSTGSTGNSIWTGAGDYWAICRKDGHRDSERAYINIQVDNSPQPQSPRPNLRAEKNPVKPNENTVVYADGCDGTVSWSNGSTGNSIWTGAGDYWAVCRKDGHRDSEQAYITVALDNGPIEQPQALRPNLRAEKGSLKPGENTVVYADGCDGTVSWSNGATGNSIWTGAGEYWAVCRKDGHRDSERAYINIPVDNSPDPQAPTPNLRAETNPVDPGGQTRIFADGCGGTVVWSNGSTANPLTTGAGDYSAICQMGAHRDSQRAYIKIEQRSNPCPSPLSPALSGADEVGKGQNFALYLTGCNGATYTANTSGGQQFQVNEDNKLFFYGSIDNTTQFQVECRKDGCPPASASKTVRVKPACVTPAAPSISGPTQVFKGETVQLGASGCTDASTFNWSGPGSPLARVPSGVSTFEAVINSETRFTVSCTVEGGCTSPAATHVVRVIEIPKDKTPKWQPTGQRCEGTGTLWKDTNQDSPSFGQTRCEGGCANPVIEGPGSVGQGNSFELLLRGCAGGTAKLHWSGQTVSISQELEKIYEDYITESSVYSIECHKAGCPAGYASKAVIMNQ